MVMDGALCFLPRHEEGDSVMSIGRVMYYNQQSTTFVTCSLELFVKLFGSATDIREVLAPAALAVVSVGS
jgi:hypothetical protein